ATKEISDDNGVAPLRTFAATTFIEVAYPTVPVCGDNTVNQIPNRKLLLGEECDGTDDSACPGQCLPPGDIFECTCGNIPRYRQFADASLTDSDAGWSGASHDQVVGDQSGFIVTRSNCDCSELTDNTCTGSSTDPVCDLQGRQLPVCSFEPGSNTRCDARGNGNFSDEDEDCWICDQFSANAGAFCAEDADCAAQCFDAAGAATGPCLDQTDCNAGEACRGQCDRSQHCIIIPNGAPFPVGAAGAAVCSVQVFRSDVVGTQDMITGEHSYVYNLFAVTHLGIDSVTPCPVCGGFCEGGEFDGAVCEGTCSVTASQSCRFSSDCPPGESCTTASPTCAGGICKLSLICGGGKSGSGDGGQNQGQPCEIEAQDPIFGTTSNDCQPSAGLNISGEGLAINHTAQTSGFVSVAAALPCTALGFELYDCPCPRGTGGASTKPNSCNFACNAGLEFGSGCADGFDNGLATTCLGGPNDGLACDEDGDCPGGGCSNNPTHCVGDLAFERFPCSSDAECGTGTCVDACPSGRCVPLCVPDPVDPRGFEGMCASGPARFHCSSSAHVFRLCSPAAAASSCSATCSVTATPCTGQDDCPEGETCSGLCPLALECEAGNDSVIGTADDVVGAGICVEDTTNCFMDPIEGEGGSTLNGLGDPTHFFNMSFYCYPPTNSSSINQTMGAGGPGRNLTRGLNVANGTSVP
ncbi:MAG: hypothetical protein ACE5E4_07075, partial [Candidatus Binatia bacterium]